VLRGLGPRDARAETLRLLELVRLPARTADRFPRELSGGERQRIAIARAAVAQPDLIVCDEITSALDVSVQGAVIELLADLRQAFGLSLLFITHDLGVVASIADRVLVLDRGRICEEGPIRRVFTAPTHPRARELLEAAPRLASSA
jgi:peptide/nickel transport system ATP-binding protein